ncbi:MAG: cytochrome c biogenesis protein CcsA [Acidimicrobiia bacterium]|nr:MAG: cytochrome c biogenesis protein CcsA [Acidimicrobiia bacterium]
MPSEIRSRSWPWAAIGVSVAVALALAMVSPADAVQGELVRIMYVHVPAAWLAYLAFIVTLVASVGYLATRNLRWDRAAASSAEIGVYFTGLAIGLGMIWAKPTWGVWWTWDARLTLTAIMFFVYVGYLALRNTADDSRVRAARSAVLGILGAALIPIVHFSVVWWRTLHQPPSLLRPDGPAIQDPLMRWALLAGVIAFTVIYVALMVKRIELHRLTDRIRDVERSVDRPVAGASVTAPDLGGGLGDE